VPGDARLIPPPGPASIAVHYYGDVRWKPGGINLPEKEFVFGAAVDSALEFFENVDAHSFSN
jgi:hypothetical protein